MTVEPPRCSRCLTYWRPDVATAELEQINGVLRCRDHGECYDRRIRLRVLDEAIKRDRPRV